MASDASAGIVLVDVVAICVELTLVIEATDGVADALTRPEALKPTVEAEGDEVAVCMMIGRVLNVIVLSAVVSDVDEFVVVSVAAVVEGVAECNTVGLLGGATLLAVVGICAVPGTVILIGPSEPALDTAVVESVTIDCAVVGTNPANKPPVSTDAVPAPDRSSVDVVDPHG